MASDFVLGLDVQTRLPNSLLHHRSVDCAGVTLPPGDVQTRLPNSLLHHRSVDCAGVTLPPGRRCDVPWTKSTRGTKMRKTSWRTAGTRPSQATPAATTGNPKAGKLPSMIPRRPAEPAANQEQVNLVRVATLSGPVAGVCHSRCLFLSRLAHCSRHNDRSRTQD